MIWEDGSFVCTIRIRKNVIGEEKVLKFTDKTTTREIKFE